MFKEKIKSLMLKENSKDSKKKIENIVVFIIILIITVIAINSIWNGKKETSENKKTTVDTTKQLASDNNIENSDDSKTSIEKELESILSNIEGVGDVKVLITYSQSSEVVAMYNENSKNSQVEEKDSGRRC